MLNAIAVVVVVLLMLTPGISVIVSPIAMWSWFGIPGAIGGLIWGIAVTSADETFWR